MAASHSCFITLGAMGELFGFLVHADAYASAPVPLARRAVHVRARDHVWVCVPAF